MFVLWRWFHLTPSCSLPPSPECPHLSAYTYKSSVQFAEVESKGREKTERAFLNKQIFFRTLWPSITILMICSFFNMITLQRISSAFYFAENGYSEGIKLQRAERYTWHLSGRVPSPSTLLLNMAYCRRSIYIPQNLYFPYWKSNINTPSTQKGKKWPWYY